MLTLKIMEETRECDDKRKEGIVSTSSRCGNAILKTVCFQGLVFLIGCVVIYIYIYIFYLNFWIDLKIKVWFSLLFSLKIGNVEIS